MNETIRQRLVDIVARTSYEYRSEPFELASGERSNHYVDCKKGLSYAEARSLIGDLMLEAATGLAYEAVGGLELGAYPIGMAVSDAAYRRHGGIVKAVVARKTAKSHGLKRLVEGDLSGVERILVVDDVITTGKSTIQAIRQVRSEGLTVVGVVAIVDRQESNGRQNIENENVPFFSLMTLNDLVYAHERQLVVNADERIRRAGDLLNKLLSR